MTGQPCSTVAGQEPAGGPALGTPGYLWAFAWTLLLAMLAPDGHMPLVAAICLGIVAVIYRVAPRRILAPRRLMLLLLFVLPPLFVLGEADRSLFGLRYSSAGLQVSLAIGLRMVVVLSAAEGLSRRVDPAALAGAFERAGLRGLGFALGVALNMLPSLQDASRNTWQALKMRGGLRRQWSQAIRWLVASILCNALRRAEEVALAAEARAFTPESGRPMPISKGRLDWLPAALGPAGVLLAVVPWQRIFA